MHSLLPSLKCLCCTYGTISLVPTYPFYCTITERTCFSQRLNRATRLRERRPQAHLNTIATISSYLSAARRPAGRKLVKLLRENTAADVLRKSGPSLPVCTSSGMHTAAYNHQQLVRVSAGDVQML